MFSPLQCCKLATHIKDEWRHLSWPCTFVSRRRRPWAKIKWKIRGQSSSFLKKRQVSLWVGPCYCYYNLVAHMKTSSWTKFNLENKDSRELKKTMERKTWGWTSSIEKNDDGHGENDVVFFVVRILQHT